MLHNMYRFSMEWFQQIFVECLSNVKLTESSDKPHIPTIIESLTATVLKRTSFALSSEHYKAFVFRFCCLLCMNDTYSFNDKLKLSREEWETMIKVCSLLRSNTDEFCGTEHKSSTLTGKSKPGPISERIWNIVCFLEKWLPSYTGLQDHIATHLDLWLKFQNCSNPIASFRNMPEHNGFAPSMLTTFQQLLLVQVLCVSRFSQEVDKFIGFVLGDQFHERPVVSLPGVLGTTNHWTPILLLLSGGKCTCIYAHMFVYDCFYHFSLV